MLRNILVSVLVVAIVANLIFLSTGDLTTREVGLLSTLLAILSIVGSWIVAHIYAESSNRKAIAEVREFHQSNLRTYALNAAEKVNNVSLQLNRLSGFLQDALTIGDDESPRENVVFFIERINSAVHILQTLRSVNDTTLNDWRGVIDEELEEQREEREAREVELRTLIDRVQNLEVRWRDGAGIEGGSVTRTELEDVRKEIRALIREVTGSSLGARTAVERLVAKCPSCGAENKYGQYQGRDNIRNIKCVACGIELVSKYVESTKLATLEVPKLVVEELTCPNCSAQFRQELSAALHAKADHRCKLCASTLRIKRNSNKVRVRVISQKVPISEDILDKIQITMPPQPWPTGIHKVVQAELGISPKTYQRAINELIARGVFKRQEDGRLLDSDRPSRTTSSK